MTVETNTASGRKVQPVLGVIALLLLFGGCLWILKPFVGALLWASILSFALYPLQVCFTKWLKGRKTLAACFVTLLLTLIISGPVVWMGLRLAEDGKALAVATRDGFMNAPEQPPQWMSGLPVVGAELSRYWQGFAEDRKHWIARIDAEVLVNPKSEETQEIGRVAKSEEKGAGGMNLVGWVGKLLAWARSGLIATGVAVGQGVTQFGLSAFLTFFLLKDSKVLAERLLVGVERIDGERGLHLMKVAADTVKGVICGVLGTALAQACVAGLGFWIAGVPGAIVLGMLTFFFAVIPFGPPLVWIPATVWLFMQGHSGMGIFMMVWGFFGISSVDNVLRPYLISQNSKMPFVMIFCGVVGGIFSFGLVGVFIGPTLLALAFRLVDEWCTPVSGESKKVG
jgi:predicted PurR-regulated permease PerM